MEMQLIGSYPGKRFDWDSRLCLDGRGGWMMSQMNVDRCVDLEEEEAGSHYLIFCLAVLVADAKKDDKVAATRMTAMQGGTNVGVSEYEWSATNTMWNMHEGNAAFEWPQSIEIDTDSYGLVTISIHVKLKSSGRWVLVNGNAYTRILETNLIPNKERRHASALLYNLLRFVPLSIRKRFQ